jgi:hypothetical protein
MSRKQRIPLEGPAKLHAGHSLRLIGHGAGAARAWKNDAEHPLTLAHAKGQLAKGNPRYTADDRFRAGDEYRALFERMHPRNRDSTDRDPLGTAQCTGAPIALTMAEATKKIVAIDSHLSARDRAIIRHVCGEGWSPAQAVRDALGHDWYKDRVVPRFNEALDALIEAMIAARRSRYALPLRAA